MGMNITALSPSANIEWLDLRTYLDRKGELVWRMENRIPEKVLAPVDRDQRLALFRAESIAANRIAKEIELMEAVSNRRRIGVKTGTGPRNSWCFLFTQSDAETPVFVDDLGDAFHWLGQQSVSLIATGL
jgi:hypothetical protein